MNPFPFCYRTRRNWKSRKSKYDYGVRFYDPVIGRFTTVDPSAESYHAITPYGYVNNNPVNSIDPDGRDLIVLQAPNDAGGLGHAAVLIGNADKWYYFYSKGGTKENAHAFGPSDDHKVDGKYYAIKADFLKSENNKDPSGSKYKAGLEFKTDKTLMIKWKQLRKPQLIQITTY